jgi:ribosomal protein L37AE/L43A
MHVQGVHVVQETTYVTSVKVGIVNANVTVVKMRKARCPKCGKRNTYFVLLAEKEKWFCCNCNDYFERLSY